MDSRHTRRRHIVQNLFAVSFNSSRLPHPAYKETQEILKEKDTLDAVIASHATKFSTDKIAKIDLAILRLALYEMLIERKNPQKVIINEAVELARELGGDQSYAFVNGILGKVAQGNK